MRKVTTAGGILMDGHRILLIRKGSRYGLVKGHVEAGETIEETAVREVLEETGMQVTIVRYLGKANRDSREKGTGELVNKDIEMFLVGSAQKVSDELDEIPEWVHFDAAVKNMFHPAEAQFLQLHRRTLLEKVETR